ncbi:rSAM-modified peptide [Flavobacterium sp. ANB]|nr:MULTISPECIES: rSAM-modified peptide [unclassified Flavobacterium]MBF4515062.1 rSAM-modified peptide [Flavobacterium sp. ANB]MTD69974.1 rSAM-modified peptide [Flavobacterium sp. LC2016-13]
MAGKNLKFESFKIEMLSKSQQKTVRGGDDPIDPPKDPNKGGIGGNGGTS